MLLGDDFTFSSQSKGSRVAYATSGDCYSKYEGCAQGRFSLDLTDTSFRLAKSVRWIHNGHKASSYVDIQVSKRKMTLKFGTDLLWLKIIVAIRGGSMWRLLRHMHARPWVWTSGQRDLKTTQTYTENGFWISIMWRIENGDHCYLFTAIAKRKLPRHNQNSIVAIFLYIRTVPYVLFSPAPFCAHDVNRHCPKTSCIYSICIICIYS